MSREDLHGPFNFSRLPKNFQLGRRLQWLSRDREYVAWHHTWSKPTVICFHSFISTFMCFRMILIDHANTEKNQFDFHEFLMKQRKKNSTTFKWCMISLGPTCKGPPLNKAELLVPFHWNVTGRKNQLSRLIRSHISSHTHLLIKQARLIKPPTSARNKTCINAINDFDWNQFKMKTKMMILSHTHETNSFLSIITVIRHKYSKVIWHRSFYAFHLQCKGTCVNTKILLRR